MILQKANVLFYTPHEIVEIYMKLLHKNKLLELLSAESKDENHRANVIADQIKVWLQISDPEQQMTFEELYECCGDAPPVKLSADIFYSVGLSYLNLPLKFPDNALKLFEFAANNGVANASYSLGCCYFWEPTIKRDWANAKFFFLKYIATNPPLPAHQESLNNALLDVALVSILESNYPYSKECQQKIAVGSTQRQIIDTMVKYIDDNNYTQSILYLYDSGFPELAIDWLLRSSDVNATIGSIAKLPSTHALIQQVQLALLYRQPPKKPAKAAEAKESKEDKTFTKKAGGTGLF